MRITTRINRNGMTATISEFWSAIIATAIENRDAGHPDLADAQLGLAKQIEELRRDYERQIADIYRRSGGNPAKR